ncbi:MAG: RNA polymerase sigma factor, partial [Planctomycetia bacterium]
LTRAIHHSFQQLGLGRRTEVDDILQGMFAIFFHRAREGSVVIESAGALRKLLLTMTRNRVNDEARRQYAQRRDDRRVEAGSLDWLAEDATDRTPSPSRMVAGDEIVEEIYRRLTNSERYLAEQRVDGQEWAALANELGVNADALRKKLTRSMTRVVKQLDRPNG